MNRRSFLAGLLVALGSVGCAATGPSYQSLADQIPSTPAGHGRIYFYRGASLLGAAVQSPILLDGKEVGKSVRKSFFFVDREPGDCAVSCRTEAERTLTFTLDQGQTRYVRTSVAPGIMIGRIHPELVDPAEGATALEGLAYIGPPLLPK